MKKTTKQLLFERMHIIGGMPLSESLLNEITSTQAKEKFYKNIPDEIYGELVAADPTYNPEKDIFGKYSKWILQQYQNRNFKDEDIYKIKDYLTYFDKYKNKIDQKDINQYKTPVELFQKIEPIINAEKTGDEDIMSNRELENKVKTEEAEKIYEDENWTVVIPKTERASCYYGKGTQWCTAADRSNNMFGNYNNQGHLYIIINKENPEEKYQFHFESGQYMDRYDDEIDIMDFFSQHRNKGLEKFFMSKIPNKYEFDGLDFIRTDEGNTYLYFDEYSDFSDLFQGRDLNRDFIANILNGDGYQYFETYENHSVGDWLDEINDYNQSQIENITGVEWEDFIEDYDEYDDVVDSISRALGDAEMSANESEAYNQIVDMIFDAFDKIGDINYDGKKMRFEITPSKYMEIFFRKDGDDEFYIQYESPYYGYQGDMDNEYFNGRLSELLDEL